MPEQEHQSWLDKQAATEQRRTLLIRVLAISVVVTALIYFPLANLLALWPWASWRDVIRNDQQTAYLITGHGNIIGLAFGLIPKWKYSFTEPRRSYPYGIVDSTSINSAGNLLISSRNSVFEVNQKGVSVWKFSLPQKEELRGLHAPGRNAVAVSAYKGEGTVGITNSGEPAWYLDGLEPVYMHVVSSDQQIFLLHNWQINSHAIVAAAVDASGSLVWKRSLEGDMLHDVAYEADGNSYWAVSSTSEGKIGRAIKGKLVALDNKGKVRWSFDGIPAHSLRHGTLRLDHDHICFVAETRSGQELITLSREGEVLRRKCKELIIN